MTAPAKLKKGHGLPAHDPLGRDHYLPVLGNSAKTTLVLVGLAGEESGERSILRGAGRLGRGFAFGNPKREADVESHPNVEKRETLRHAQGRLWGTRQRRLLKRVRSCSGHG